MSNPNPSPATRFGGGINKSNLNGRPRGSVSITARLRAMIEQQTSDGTPVVDKIAAGLLRGALLGDFKGDIHFLREVLNRVDGKVPDQVTISGDPDRPVLVKVLKGVSFEDI